ncbi:MAG: hypothetical protein IPK35_22205 [Saprospiraceae bacterium]|jgi:hypothetical protein|nr:hypothetical protein [Saprospiraceae bacterium]
MKKNSFKELETLYIQGRSTGAQETRQKIESNIHLFGFIANILDLYLPKAGNVIQSLGSFNTVKNISDLTNNSDKNSKK